MIPFIKLEGNLPTFILKLEIQKAPLFLRNLKCTWFKITGSIQCKSQTQAGSPEVRFFCTSWGSQQLFHHLTSPLGSGKLSDPHPDGDAGEREQDACSAVDMDTDFHNLYRAQWLKIRLPKLGVNIQGWEYLKVLLISKKYVSSQQPNQPFYLLQTTTNPELPPSSSASVWPLFYVSKAGIFCLTVLKN